jgi:hypothetical protein
MQGNQGKLACPRDHLTVIVELTLAGSMLP